MIYEGVYIDTFYFINNHIYNHFNSYSMVGIYARKIKYTSEHFEGKVIYISAEIWQNFTNDNQASCEIVTIRHIIPMIKFLLNLNMRWILIGCFVPFYILFLYLFSFLGHMWCLSFVLNSLYNLILNKIWLNLHISHESLE